MKTASDFQQAAQEKNIEGWFFRSCSICTCPVGFVFRDGRVFFDGNCDCGSWHSDLAPRTWDEVAELYNAQTHPETIAAFNKYWGFE